LLRWFLWFNNGIGGSSMSNKHFCQGPRCHEQVTQDRFLKSRGVIRGRYAYATRETKNQIMGVEHQTQINISVVNHVSLMAIIEHGKH
jgi:hypothetical protein